ncbi:MAG: NAD(P)-dependent oxidoreductase [Novosphingobium sp.]|nr:NAD(P)-dependent oxidoreductase [Novosphingobium sp.]
MKIAITGGTGFIGGALVDQAIAQGYDLALLTRRPQEKREGVEWVSGDLDDKEALVRLVSDSDLVIHVAGVVKAANSAEFERGNVVGTLNLIEAVREVGPERFILVSSLTAREPGVSVYGASKAQSEKLVMASPLDWTIVRPPAVYGPGDGEMLDLFRSAKYWLIPAPEQGRTSVIHVDDLVRLLLALDRGSEQVTGRTFEPDDGMLTGWSHYDLARAIGHAVGRRPKVMGFSRRTMEWVAKIDSLLRGRKAKMTLDRAAYFNHPDWVVSKQAIPPSELWRPEIKTRDGLKATAQWYREHRWL